MCSREGSFIRADIKKMETSEAVQCLGVNRPEEVKEDRIPQQTVILKLNVDSLCSINGRGGAGFSIQDLFDDPRAATIIFVD